MKVVEEGGEKAKKRPVRQQAKKSIDERKKKPMCGREKDEHKPGVLSSLSVGIESATHPKIEVRKWRISFGLQESTFL